MNGIVSELMPFKSCGSPAVDGLKLFNFFNLDFRYNVLNMSEISAEISFILQLHYNKRTNAVQLYTRNCAVLS